MAQKSRAALLVGINNCWLEGWETLRFAESDCRKLADALCQPQYGFSHEDIRILAASQKEPRERPFRNNFLYGDLFAFTGNEQLDLFVFYFAGHGIEHDERTYLVPADGVCVHNRISKECEPVIETGIPLELILGRVSSVPALRRLIILDICRGGGIHGASPGLPRSFDREVARVREAVVLSACSIEEDAHECDKLNGGVFTHFWCEGLRGAVKPSPEDHSITVFDVQKYAEAKVHNWAISKGVTQRPRIWANCPVIYLTAQHQHPPLPPFLNDSISRTETIVRALQRLLYGPAPVSLDDYCVRIRAQLSSFAISESEPWSSKRLQLRDLLLEERDNLILLFKKGASLKVILSWDLDKYLGLLPEASADQVKARLLQLRDFCQETLADEELVLRATIIRLPTPERNLLLLGTDYFFEGRRLGIRMGFDATQLITDTDVIKREIAMFDALFEEGVKYVCGLHKIPARARRNQHLLEVIIKDLDKDIRRLETMKANASQSAFVQTREEDDGSFTTTP